MRRIFLDANIIIAVLNKEYPLFANAARILSLADRPNYGVFTSPVCLAIAFYFVEKKSGTSMANKKIEALAKHLKITSLGKTEVDEALHNKAIHDFEDGLEYYSAIHSGCDIIITENINDFSFSEIPVLTAEKFIASIRAKK
jgi:predicted nucleic acid-binding protein